MPVLANSTRTRYITDTALGAFTEFRIVVDTTKAGSASNQFVLPLISTGQYTFNVDWGDGNVDRITAYNQAETTHTYSVGGTYTVRIKGKCWGWRFANGGDKLKLTEIQQWGNSLRLLDVYDGSYFRGCANLQLTAVDAPDLSLTHDMTRAFQACYLLNSNLNHWDWSNTTRMHNTFNGCSAFNNGSTSDDGANPVIWNTSNVWTFNDMFKTCSAFNQDLSGLDTASGQYLSGLVSSCSNFNNGDTGDNNAKPLTLNTTNVTSISSLCYYCPKFNQMVNLTSFAKLTDISYAFYKVTITNKFNQDLSSWTPTAVTNATALCNDINAVGTTTNYDALLNSWASVLPSGTYTLGMGSSKYSAAGATARALLVSKGWTVTDGGLL